jgi:soluble lytic murein transglycosylase-like protein
MVAGNIVLVSLVNLAKGMCMRQNTAQSEARITPVCKALCAVLFACAFSCHPPPAMAQAPNSDADAKPAAPKPKIYQYRVGRTTTFSDRPPNKGAYIIWRPSCFACKITSAINWRAIRLYLSEFTDFIDSASQTHAVDPALVRAVIHAESNFNPLARSNKGASGLMQLMPGTAHSLGVREVFTPSHNIDGGVQYLARLLKRFNGNVDLALAAYNAGPEAVAKYSGVPPYQETLVYVERVKILHERYKEQR